jgi:hypothetical protein
VTSSLGGTFVNYPRVFTGSSFQYEAFASAGAFIEQRFTMTYQTAPSIAANDAKPIAPAGARRPQSRAEEQGLRKSLIIGSASILLCRAISR